jgi:uncharacterized protein
MRFLVRLRATKVPKGDLLQAVKTIARTFGVDPRNPKWTSYGALELDIFSPTKGDFELLVSAIEPLAEFEFAKDLNIAPAYKPEEGLCAEARELFNAERYWECHEVLEGVWKTKQGDDKRLLQGIILVCAGFVHHQKGEDKVALGVFRRSVPLLDYPRDYGGFKVSRLRKNVEGLIRTGRVTNFKL